MQRLKVYYRFIKGLPSTGFYPEKILLFFRVRRHTLLSPERLNNVYELVEEIERKRKKGVLVECGVWRGGCAAVMAYVLKKHASKRKYAF